MLSHFRHRKRNHIMWVIIIGLIMLFGITCGVGYLLGMDRKAFLILFPLFILVGWLMEMSIEHC